MVEQSFELVSRSWMTRRDKKRRRMQVIQPGMKGPILTKENLIEVSKLSSSVETRLCLREITRNRLISSQIPGEGRSKEASRYPLAEILMTSNVCDSAYDVGS